MHNVTVAFAALLVMLLSYFFGCFNGSFMVSHFIIRDDVRKHGSGNAGLTNFYRTYGGNDRGGVPAGLLFLPLAGRGRHLGDASGGSRLCAGHIFPVFYGFRGGKGILSGGTLVLLLNWRVAAMAWALFLLLWLTTRYVSLASITATCSAPITVYFVYGHNWLYTGLCLAVAALVVWCHRENIQRLLHGTEKKFKWHVNPTEGKDPPK